MPERCSICSKALRKPLPRHCFEKSTKKGEYVCHECFHDCIAKDPSEYDFDLMETYRTHVLDLIKNNYYKDESGHVIKEGK